MNRRFLGVFLAVWGCWVGPAGAQEPWFGKEIPASEGIPVGDYGDLTELEIEGNEHFSVEDIRDELVDHVRLQAACRPSSEIVPLIDLLQEVLQEAYRQSGCPDAKVSVTPSEERQVLRAVVEEGARYSAGEIRVHGVEPGLAGGLAQYLKTSESKSPARKGMYLARGATRVNQESSSDRLWVAGEPVRGSQNHLARIRQALIDELAIAGYPLAKLEVEIVPNPDDSQIADLVVDIIELGPRARLNVIEIEGLERHARNELLALMQISEGDALDVEALALAFDRVRDSCRFWRHDFVVQLPIPAEPKWRYDTADPRTKLVIKLIEYDFVPKLGEPLGEVDEILRRSALWTREFFEQDEWAVRVRYWSGETYHKVSDLEVDGVYSPSDGLYADVAFLLTHAGSSTTQLANVVLNPRYTAMSNLAGDARFILLGGRMSQGFLTVVGSEKVNGLFQATFHLGMSASSRRTTAPRISFAMDPVVLVHEAHRPDSHVERQGDVLIIERPRAKWQIDSASGRIREVQLNDGHQQQVQIVSVKQADTGLLQRLQAIHALPDRNDRENLFESVTLWTLDSAEQLSSDAPIIPPAVRLATRQWIEAASESEHRARETRSERELRRAREFRLAEGGTDWDLSLAGLRDSGAACSDLLFERGTWPWTLFREVNFIARGLSKDEEGKARYREELARTLSRDDAGPVAFWAYFHASFLNAEGAEMGVDRLDDGSFEREVEMLTTPDTGIMKLLAKVVPVVQSLPEEDTNWLCGLAGDDMAPKLEEVSRLLRKLDASSHEALQQSLRALLEGEIRERVEADLRAAASAPD
ncbi:hypothetical protein [Aeoliella sp. SH292]|uniref:hypothetical protein n=1 Tax=Aeoliella sp. SH292 TaxID=3454464 RepID=UPI003F9E4753